MVDKNQKKALKSVPPLTILVGIPGSGKSEFGRHLSQLNDERPQYTIISQDILGSRDACALAVQKWSRTRPTPHLVIDRCCQSSADRSDWCRAAGLAPAKTAVVHFDIELSVCQSRVASRKDHPTIKGGDRQRSDRIVDSFHKKMEAPSESEGFQCTHVIRSDDDFCSVLGLFGCNSSAVRADMSTRFGTEMFFKFPRTSHLFDAGGSAVTRDDLLLDDGQAAKYFGPNARTLLVQEKVDGANLGISVTSDWQIRCQNRAKYVHEASGSQWKALGPWLQHNRANILAVLEPGRHILFGEWCVAKHSIHYDQLQDYFCAFDVFDRHEQRFVSRRKMQRMLGGRFEMVPNICERTFATREELSALLDTPSRLLSKGFVEGVYLRIEEGAWLVDRCKLVRPDFVQGITKHWMSQIMVKNKLTF